MRGGNNKKPAIIKVLEGNRRKVGKARIGVDPAGLGRPQPPIGLTEIERGLWEEVVGSLPKNLLSRADNAILERFCIAWARFRDCQSKIKATGLLVQSPQGPVRNPLLVAQNAAAKEMHATGGELGLSPVARARLNTTTPPGEEDPLDYLMGMGEGESNSDWMPPPLNKRN